MRPIFPPYMMRKSHSPCAANPPRPILTASATVIPVGTANRSSYSPTPPTSAQPFSTPGGRLRATSGETARSASSSSHTPGLTRRKFSNASKRPPLVSVAKSAFPETGSRSAGSGTGRPRNAATFAAPRNPVAYKSKSTRRDATRRTGVLQGANAVAVQHHSFAEPISPPTTFAP